VSAWAELVAAALVGTDRRPLPDAADPATAVLDRAAAWGVYRRAGAPPVRGLTPPRPAPADARPLVGPAAAARLAGLLAAVWEGAGRMSLVAEWLSVADERGRRVPPELLPDLLDTGRRHPDLRSLIVAAGGPRAVWLAEQSPEWTYAVALSSGRDAADRDPTAWREGTTAQRFRHLAAVRRDDAAAGLTLLAEEWPTLGPDERTQLLPGLRTGLGPADEEFLEAALDDRRREVRAVAADLLGALPGSAYNRRMADRVRACLRREGATLAVRPPSECDAAMSRDGIVARPPAGVGARAWWLEQVLARAPLDALTDLTPELVATASTVDDWTWTTYRGLARAAAARRDHAWAAALVDRLAERTDARDRHLVDALHGALARDELVGRATAAVAAEPGPEALRRLESLLAHVRPPWPDELAVAGLRWIDMAARGPLGNRLHGLCGLAATGLAPRHAGPARAMADRLKAEAPSAPAGFALERLAVTLGVRHDMIEELTR
jgi:hypothetical protein